MEHIYSDYDNYRWMNYNRWSNAKEVDALVSHLIGSIDSRKRSAYHANMKIVVMDLYSSYLADKEQYIAFHRGKDFYLAAGEGNHYVKNRHVSYDYLVGCIKHLIKLDMIEHHRGGQFYNEELGEFHSYVSRMRANSALISLWQQYNISPEMITKFVPDELIKMKAPKEIKEYVYKGKTKKKWIKPPMECPDNSKTRGMIKIIERYNNLLERTKIDVDIECLSIKHRDELVDRMTRMDMKNKRVILRLADKSVYRVFNNGSLEQGGRFYGAWWIGAPGIVRKYITINGKQTKELDYSGIHIHLLYAMKGVNYADKDEDPYTLDDGKPDRELNKLILLTAFNADGPEDTASAVFDELRKEGLLSRYGFKSHDPIIAKFDLLKAKHSPISEYIAQDFGAQLQYYDSCVMEKLIDYFTREGVPILTVHDSVLCQAEHSEFIKDKMWSLYSKTVREKLKCKIVHKSINPHAGNVIRAQFRQRERAYNMDVAKFILKQRRDINARYSGRVPVDVNSIIAIKSDQRDNTCSGRCNHSKRIKLNNMLCPTIKLTLQHQAESFTNIFVIQ